MKLRIYRLLSILTIVFGVVLQLYMMFVEDEPNIVGPLLIAGGTAGFFITRTRIRAQQN